MTRPFTKTLLIAGVSAALFGSYSVNALPANNGSPLGMNVSMPSDAGTVLPWVDMFMWFRGFERNGSGGFPAAQLDSCGWVESLNAGEEADVGHGAGTQKHFPGGDYTLTWDGDGTLGPRGDCTFKSYDEANRRAVVHVDSAGSNGWYGIKITRTNASNYVRNIHLIMPGFENTWSSDIWHPSFITSLQKFKCLRFMDWGGTNGSNVVNWTDLKPGTWWSQGGADGYTGPGSGTVSPIWMIRLCNKLNADGWFCIPAKANDSCISKYAQLLRDSLSPKLKVYIEYSNECWNWAFPQTGYLRDQGVALSLPSVYGGVTQGSSEYFALRSSQMWRIFDRVFGTQKTRVEKVCAWQQGSDKGGMNDGIFSILNNPTYNPDNEQPTALSMAPYFYNDGNDGAVRTDNLTNMFADIMNIVLPAKRAAAQSFVNFSKSKNMKLVAYEGGESFWGDAPFAALNAAAQNDPRMKDVYLKYLQDWFDVGGGMFNAYAQCSLGGSYGYWGAMDYYNQPRSQSPKYDALLTYIEGHSSVTALAPRPSANRPLRAKVMRRLLTTDRAFTIAGSSVSLVSKNTNGTRARFGNSSSRVCIVKTAGGEYSRMVQ